jgi:hypothetical protein
MRSSIGAHFGVILLGSLYQNLCHADVSILGTLGSCHQLLLQPCYTRSLTSLKPDNSLKQRCSALFVPGLKSQSLLQLRPNRGCLQCVLARRANQYFLDDVWQLLQKLVDCGKDECIGLPGFNVL